MIELRVNKILDLVPGVLGTHDVVTDASGPLHVLEKTQLDNLARLKAAKSFASIAYDTTTRNITAVGSSPRDNVLAVTNGATEAAVQLMKRPSLLRLATSHPRFLEIIARLEEARTSGREINIGVLPGSVQIEDARLDP